ncbi:hypothetical protein JYU34_007633 [Plutella xylostella]|uniref:RNA-directed DNA polymerase n=1 Tax=Plutella xylostella TaxID=51655 RepID=A0ABQ7QQV9_PLUXY|nr:hypothetical protein JYU34_007633 [Plutella xylostella]
MQRVKKLNNENCGKPAATYFDISEWNKWLLTIKSFFTTHSVSPIFNSKPSEDPRPYVKIRINNTDDLDMYGLLDSGSSVTILGRDSHKRLLQYDLTMCTDDIITVTAAGGQKITSLGFMLLPVSFEEKFSLIKAHIVPEIDTTLILGIDFWTEFDLCPKYLSNSENLFQTDPGLSEISSEVHLHAYDNLDSAQKQIADDVLEQFKDISFGEKGLGRTQLITHKINTGDAEPIRQRYYRMSPEKQRIITEQVDEMLALDVVEPCESPWSSPVLVVGKKDGKPRFCLDSRKLNAVTKKDAYNLPYVSEILDNLKDARYLSSIDLSKSFWQILINEPDREKTAFYVPGRGSLMFKVTAFGLTNAPATQQRLVDMLFGPEFELKVFAYLDDFIIISKTFEEHVSLLQRVLDKLRSANLTVNLDKCQFFRSKLRYLGYIVDAQGLRTDPEKVEAILNYPTPTTRKEVKRFLGTASWYRRFIPHFSTVAGPLNSLTSTKKNSPPFQWTPEADKAFLELKSRLVQAPVLACPNFDYPFEVHTDASNFGIGAMLAQTIDGVEHPVAYMSRSLNKAERNYSTTEREALAVLTALEHWRCYLENGSTFSIFTDHAALKWFLSLSNPTGRLARWGVRLSSFNFEIKHRRGKDNVVPDALSRAFPTDAITSSSNDVVSSPPTTKDPWYLKIYKGCQESPISFPNYRVENNTLYRHMKNKIVLTSEFDWKQVVPLEQRENVLNECHSEPIAGHFGVFKTYKRLALRFYWPGMYADVVGFISRCDTCLAYKLPTHGTLGKMGRPKDVSRPFQVLSIDLVGPLPNTRKQNNYIFVVTCCFSKYCFIFPLRRATADLVTKHLENDVFLVHGIPQTVVLDNGCQFISHELDRLFKKYKVPNVHFTPKYTPQVNTVERYNKTIVTAVSTFVNNDHRTWDLNLPQIQFAINNSVNETTGYSPAFLVHGRELVTCGSHYLENDDSKDMVFLPRDAYAENLGHLAGIFGEVQAALWQAHAKNSQRYNLRRKDAEFNVGDIVWKRCYFQSDKDAYFAKKLAPKYQKCRVKHKRSPLVYILEDMNGRDLGVWHIKDLKIVNTRLRE